MKSLLSAFAALILLTVCSGYSEALDKKEIKLENGLTIIYVQRTGLPVVMASMLIKASPLYEPAQKPGVAYLTSAMLTEGTSTRIGLQISKETEFMGASLGASTNSDFTMISLSVLKKDAAKGFELFSDVVINPVFPESELIRKKRILKGSLLQREEDPSYVVEKRFMKELFGPQHPYGRLVSGSPDEIDRITRTDLQEYHRQKYRPDHALLSVVGDISHEELVALAKKYFSNWHAAGSDGIKKADAAIKPLASTKAILIDKKTTQASIILGHPGISRSNPDYYAVSVMNYILGGGGFASRLMDAVREKRGLTYGIYSHFNALKEPGAFSVEVQTKNESAEEVLGLIKSEIRRMRTEQVSDSELGDAKSFLTGSFPRRFETSGKIADFLVAARFYGLPEDYIRKYSSYINSVTKQDVLRVAQKYLFDANYVIVIAGDKAKMKLNDVQFFEDVK
ncbi:MAG: insulinase family protein [Nitrospiraceae bacterium]|nr:insulinase family protein [Nitrospiraceae bacterium]